MCGKVYQVGPLCRLQLVHTGTCTASVATRAINTGDREPPESGGAQRTCHARGVGKESLQIRPDRSQPMLPDSHSCFVQCRRPGSAR